MHKLIYVKCYDDHTSAFVTNLPLDLFIILVQERLSSYYEVKLKITIADLLLHVTNVFKRYTDIYGV